MEKVDDRVPVQVRLSPELVKRFDHLRIDLHKSRQELLEEWVREKVEGKS